MKLTPKQFLIMLIMVVLLALFGVYVAPKVDWKGLVRRFNFNVSERSEFDDQYEEINEPVADNSWL